MAFGRNVRSIATLTFRRIVAPSPNELESFQHDRESAPLLARSLIFPLIKSQATFDKKRPSFGAILGNHFALAAPRFNINKGGLIAWLPRSILKGPIDCQTKLTNGGALGGNPELGISSEIADEEDAVEICHDEDALEAPEN